MLVATLLYDLDTLSTGGAVLFVLRIGARKLIGGREKMFSQVNCLSGSSAFLPLA